jgi:hypothetical protein
MVAAPASPPALRSSAVGWDHEGSSEDLAEVAAWLVVAGFSVFGWGTVFLEILPSGDEADYGREWIAALWLVVGWAGPFWAFWRHRNQAVDRERELDSLRGQIERGRREE